MSVLIVTSVGELVVDLHTDLCPRTTDNFLKLCSIKYYNGCLFHNVQKDFLAQTGDPTGTGRGGGSAYKLLYGDQSRFFEDEIRPDNPDLTHSKKGTVAMASTGNASQFYITLRPNVEYLDGQHTVFGTVTEGFHTLTKINEAYVDPDGRPFKDIRIKHTYILDPPHLTDLSPENSPVGKPKDEVAEERLEDTWAPLDERLDPVQLDEMIRSKEAQSNSVILECIGDIPDAQVKPPENVLFVCNLNPVTQDEDLYTVFSRFGTVASAEVIRDCKTGDSLCYAFVEFEVKKACERAFNEMNNCLIDDRRIHVDFSQSVSKMWGKFRHGIQNAKKDGSFKCNAPHLRAQNCVQASQKQDRRGTTGRRKIEQLDDWRSEPPYKGDLVRKCMHDDHTSYGNRGYSGHNARDYSKRQCKSRDQELITMTGIKKNDDCRKGVAARKRKVATKEVERHRSREDGNRETQMRGAACLHLCQFFLICFSSYIEFVVSPMIHI
ncbi:peptidyl-prolyl cis-trans isomerase CYP59-like [Lolium rigidum]|jgi:peptidyl-prolyl cis-trans isomerase-like 4|uniref:peptidyl-prolyl cis-trans isomerase CYP59-like n=1 Tax=Lolium rigidum TaxID=89674 RepID=UPI001F5C44ED|nr:peptidyl-prolyl cis-trans isomerase CYP59-like [Lolium rigidum]